MTLENDSKCAMPDEIPLEVDIISYVHGLHSDSKVGPEFEEWGTGASSWSDKDKGCTISNAKYANTSNQIARKGFGAIDYHKIWTFSFS